jgi:hypothetical protein
MPDIHWKFEGGTLKTFQGIKYFDSWLQDTNTGHGMYKQGFMEILLCFLSADGSTGVVNGLKRV